MRSKNRIAAIGLWLTVLAIGAGAFDENASAQTSPQSAADAQRMQQRFETLQQMEVGAAPLFVFGDVNEDGKVNAADLALMEQLAAGESPAAATCPAAGDFDQDGKIDAADLAAMQKVVAQGKTATPALGFPYRLPCSFKKLLVATHANANAQGENSVYFLEPQFSTDNSSVVVQTGRAAVVATADKHEYIVTAPSGPGASGMLTLKITLGKNGVGGSFTYSYHYGP